MSARKPELMAIDPTGELPCADYRDMRDTATVIAYKEHLSVGR